MKSDKTQRASEWRSVGMARRRLFHCVAGINRATSPICWAECEGGPHVR